VKLDVRLGPGLLAETVDPDRAQTELDRRRDVVEEAGPDVNVSLPCGAGAFEERVPVRTGRLVRADLGGDDREVEGHSDPGHRRLDEVTVRVGENRQLPAAAARILERSAHLGERRPRRKRARESVRLLEREAEAVLLCESGEGQVEHIAIGPCRLLALDLGLEPVVGVQQARGVGGTEQALELTPDATVPVDQGAVAVECHPAIHGASLQVHRAIDGRSTRLFAWTHRGRSS